MPNTAHRSRDGLLASSAESGTHMSRPRNIVGPNLRQLRYQRALSQGELAAACQRLGWDASRDMIAKIEGQTRWVSDSEWVFLARALRVRLEELLPTAARRALESAISVRKLRP